MDAQGWAVLALAGSAVWLVAALVVGLVSGRKLTT